MISFAEAPQPEPGPSRAEKILCRIVAAAVLKFRERWGLGPEQLIECDVNTLEKVVVLNHGSANPTIYTFAYLGFPG